MSTTAATSACTSVATPIRYPHSTRAVPPLPLSSSSSGSTLHLKKVEEEGTIVGRRPQVELVSLVELLPIDTQEGLGSGGQVGRLEQVVTVGLLRLDAGVERQVERALTAEAP